MLNSLPFPPAQVSPKNMPKKSLKAPRPRRLRLTGRSKTLAEKGNRAPIIHFVERQGRFKKMSMEQLGQLQRWVDGKWNEYLRRAES